MTKTGDGYGGDTHSFTPAGVTIQRAGTVTWNNNTGLVHNVTFAAGTGAPANVPDLGDGTATRTFNSVGTFNYQCTNHSGMSGQVIVR
jgi:plastocyanin